MPAPRQVYLHLGLQKTGTSYLQGVMRRNQDLLAEQGLDLVPAGRRESFELMLLVRGRYNPDRDPASVGGALDRFTAEPGARPRHPRPAEPGVAGRVPPGAGQGPGRGLRRPRGPRRPDRARPRAAGALLVAAGAQGRPHGHVRALARAAAGGAAGRPGQPPLGPARPAGRARALGRGRAARADPRRHRAGPGSEPTLLLERYCRVLGVRSGDLAPGPGASNTSLGPGPGRAAPAGQPRPARRPPPPAGLRRRRQAVVRLGGPRRAGGRQDPGARSGCGRGARRSPRRRWPRSPRRATTSRAASTTCAAATPRSRPTPTPAPPRASSPPPRSTPWCRSWRSGRRRRAGGAGGEAAAASADWWPGYAGPSPAEVGPRGREPASPRLCPDVDRGEGGPRDRGERPVARVTGTRARRPTTRRSPDPRRDGAEAGPPAEPQRLFFHVGPPQERLDLPADRARQQPGGARARWDTSTPTYARRGCSTRPSRWRASPSRWGLEPEAISGTFAHLLRRGRRLGGTVMISHEIFGSATRDQIARMAPLLEGFEVHLVVTVRDLGRTATAEWQEQVKNGNPRSFEAFVDDLMSHLPEDLVDTRRSGGPRTSATCWTGGRRWCPRSGSTSSPARAAAAPPTCCGAASPRRWSCPRRRRPLPDPAAQRVARHRADRVPAPGRGCARRAARAAVVLAGGQAMVRPDPARRGRRVRQARDARPRGTAARGGVVGLGRGDPGRGVPDPRRPRRAAARRRRRRRAAPRRRPPTPRCSTGCPT